jgi:hypothetical protein
MRITKKILLDAGVSNVMEGNAQYFSVAEVREKIPNVKIDTDKIKKLTIAGKAQTGVLAGDIKPMTDFDAKIAKSLNFNPNKK